MRHQLRMSWVTLDRFCQEEAAKDEPLRRKLEADNRPLRSSAAKLTDGELLDKLRGMGFELDRSGVGNLCAGALSACTVLADRFPGAYTTRSIPASVVIRALSIPS